MAIEAHLQSAHSDEQREERRYAVRRRLRLLSFLATSGERVMIHNLSVTGFLMESDAELADGERLQVHLPERGLTDANVVWQRDRFYGCEFAAPVPAAVVRAAVLRSPGQSPAPPAAAVADPAARAAGDDHYPLRTRALVIVGTSAALWVLIGLAIVLLI
ncbi:MAG TPA: hypothetical protein VM265_05270 [Sphingomicrobium sp.]|nr:hypothetical protein [Sphingomicrobium sp.]